MAALKLVCIAVVCMALAVTAVDATITCGQVTSSLFPCIPFATAGKGNVPPACCNGIKTLSGLASTTPDRQAACRCMKTAASAIKGLNYNAVASLPSLCHVSIPYKLSPSTDCNGVK